VENGFHWQESPSLDGSSGKGRVIFLCSLKSYFQRTRNHKIGRDRARHAEASAKVDPRLRLATQRAADRFVLAFFMSASHLWMESRQHQLNESKFSLIQVKNFSSRFHVGSTLRFEEL
jgi:hypothetical protein